MTIQEEVNRIIEKERNQKIESIIEEVYDYICKNNGKVDLVDISLQFTQFTCDIPCLAAARLMEAGRIERREMYGNRCAYFVK